MKCSLSDRTDRKNCLGKHEKSIRHLRNIQNISLGDREVKNSQRVCNDDNFNFRGICKIWISRTNATQGNTNLSKTKYLKKEITAFILPTETKLKKKLISAKPLFKNAQMRIIKKIDDRHFNTINHDDLLKHVSETFFEVIKRKIVNNASRLIPLLEKKQSD